MSNSPACLIFTFSILTVATDIGLCCKQMPIMDIFPIHSAFLTEP